MEQLTNNEVAYDQGYYDAMAGYTMMAEDEWHYSGNYSSYKAGYEDAIRDNEFDYDLEDE